MLNTFLAPARDPGHKKVHHNIKITAQETGNIVLRALKANIEQLEIEMEKKLTISHPKRKRAQKTVGAEA